MKGDKQNAIVRQAFTQQADKFAANPLMTNSERLARLINAVNPAKDDRVLDVATGPGLVAEVFLSICRMVVAMDVTRAPLEIAKKRLRVQGSRAVSFQLADVNYLPLAGAKFDIVVSRFAFHHMKHPELVLNEMTRVCRVHGIVAVEDIIVSEHPRRAAYQNRFEKLRDPSHTRALPLTLLLGMFAKAGLEVENVLMGSLLQQTDQWITNAGTPPAKAVQARKFIERDADEDLSGTHPFRDDSGLLKFTQRTAIIIGRRL